ncbi:MAG: hypothetical protein JOZ47_23600 [Kutzneria sp.]|nr:hypothetical protein [Kutzneria sp.]
MKPSVTSSVLRVSRGSGVPTVAFLFGMAGRTELSGATLKRLLVDMGMTDTAAHGLLARMRRDGQLASTRRGRNASYRLAGDVERGFRLIRDRAHLRPVEWTGAFHAILYQVPEQHRAFRDALRRAALLSGYGLLQHGVLIAPDDRTAGISETLRTCPADARILVTDLGMSISDAARVAREAWDLDGLAKAYRTHIDTLRQALDEPADRRGASAEALRRYASLVREPLVDTLRQPRLVPQLLPDDWIGGTLRRLIDEVHERYGPAAARHVADIVDRHDG